MSDKRQRMGAWLHGDGIEIGALHNPLPVPRGVRVRYVDRMDERGLREHYPELAGETFAPVSILGDACDLSQLPDESVDFVIANHLIEHLEDPISGLREMYRVLREGGALYVALPDPRATFDSSRTLTSVEHLVTEYRQGPAATRRAHFEEWVDNVEHRREDREARLEQLLAMDYSIHYHVWRPDTFLDFLTCAKSEIGLELELAAFSGCAPGVDNEFIFVFLKGHPSAPPSIPQPVVDPGAVTGFGGALATLRARVAASRAGPILRPVWHGIRRARVWVSSRR